MKQLLLALIRLLPLCDQPFSRAPLPFFPQLFEYTAEAVEKYGASKARRSALQAHISLPSVESGWF
jgi:putative component of membrane protein insertase Oxa1/YidC/SpoIIIJ protein YidD